MSIIPEIEKQRKAGQVPKLHPHGFIQLELQGRNRRLHVWDVDIPRTADPATMHDHVWDFTSLVLVGTLVNHVFEPDWHEDGNFMLWKCQPERQEGARGGKVLASTEQRCFIKRTGRVAINREEIYKFPAFAFHDSEGIGYTATLFEKTYTYPDAEPCVICRVGGRPDDELPFIRQGSEIDPKEVTADWMWQKIDQLAYYL